MKTVLFINGCVRESHSRTLQIANTYIQTLKEREDIHLIERNLIKEDIHFVTNAQFDQTTGQLLERNATLAKEFANADEIIFAAPYWEFMFPAIVSCYIEMISIVGITFTYTANGSVGLCKAISLVYVYTAGDELQESDKTNEAYLKRLTKLFGIPTYSSIHATGLDVDPRRAQHIVDKVCTNLKKN